MNQVANTVMIPVEEYEALREKVSDLNKVVVHQDECYAGLEKQLSDMTQERDVIERLYEVQFNENNDLVGERKLLREQLTTAQARIKELREALLEVMAIEAEITNLKAYNKTIRKAKEALATPDDSSALDAALEKAYSNGYDVGCADTTGDT